MITTETAPQPYIPQHLDPNTPSVFQEVATRTQDAMRSAYEHVQTAATAYSGWVAEGARSQSRTTRLISNLAMAGVAAVVTGVAFRAGGGAAHGAGLAFHVPDVLPHGDMHSLDVADRASEAKLAAHHSSLAEQPIVLLATTKADSGGALPADLDKSVDLGPLGPYNAHTGDGTTWNQVIEYADKMGYDKLTPKEERGLVGRALDHMGESWSSARHEENDYHPDLPSQRTMQSWLDDIHATRTHAADRQPGTPPGGADGSGSSSGTESGAPRAADGLGLAAGDHTCDSTWGTITHTHCWNRDLVPRGYDGAAILAAVLTIGGLGTAAVVGGRELDRRRAWRRRTAYMRADTVEVPVVAAEQRDGVVDHPDDPDEADSDKELMPPTRFRTDNTVTQRPEWHYKGPQQTTPADAPAPEPAPIEPQPQHGFLWSMFHQGEGWRLFRRNSKSEKV